MKIVFLNGGLANQVFQYIFYRYAQINAPEEEWYLDDSFFFVHDVHNGYELERVFGLHPNLLSELFEEDVWEYMIQLKKEQNKSIPQILLENGTDIKMITEYKNYVDWNPFNGRLIGVPYEKYNPGIIKFEGDIYYHGYWLISDWFQAVRENMLAELKFPTVTENYNQEYLSLIQGTHSCSVHVRRGDFVTIGDAEPDSYYLENVQYMLGVDPEMTLFVFSDDIEYCRSHSKEMGFNLPGKTVYVEGNSGTRAYRDMQLMSQCAYMIIGNSSFCYLAALLNRSLRMLSGPANRTISRMTAI